MVDSEAENKLKRCLEACIEIVQETTDQLKSKGQLQQDASSDAPFTNTGLDVNIHSFTLDTAEESLMSEFKTNLESVLNDHLPSLSKHCRKYLLDFLYQINYNDKDREFTNPFNIGIIDSFSRDLQSMLASIKAFQGAWNGNQQIVQEFIKNYPTAKDKSGLWGTTLLYSAARNNHLNLVKYLIRTARCSINAQNQQHIMRALSSSTMTDDKYDINPTAGSTALHGACYYGHLEVVKFLIQHGADYFITNHSHETPIANASERPDILQFFRDFLILGYSSTSTKLPNKPILEDNNEQIVDCVWEYKPFADQQWFPFSGPESSELQTSLILKSDQEFKREIHLRVRGGVYSVSMMKFLRSGKDHDYTQKIAWVRCRGSSILNFHCYALWQIMFITHPTGISESTLQMLNIPTIYDSKFKIHLHSWYFCDARTNNQLDYTMKYRRKHINLDLPFVSNDPLRFDLETFAFFNKEKTITGFIRWIPKMISNNSRNKDKIISFDQYETLTNMDPIPLTTSRLKQVSQLIDNNPVENEDEFGENINDDDDSTFDNISNIDTSDKVISLNICQLFKYSFFLDPGNTNQWSTIFNRYF
jgi:hypothetical protein